MPKVTTGDGTEICCKDRGGGQPVAFSHGWLTTEAWDTQRAVGHRSRIDA